MYGYWAYSLNYEAYQKQETELDKQLNDFFAKENTFEGKPSLIIESAFIIRLDPEHFKIDDEPIREYYLIIIGHNRFDFTELEYMLYNLYDDYREHFDLIKNYSERIAEDSKNPFTLEELGDLRYISRKYPILNCFDNNFTPREEFEDILRKKESPYGKIVKTFV